MLAGRQAPCFPAGNDAQRCPATVMTASLTSRGTTSPALKETGFRALFWKATLQDSLQLSTR
jgi:hypothetical protein